MMVNVMMKENTKLKRGLTCFPSSLIMAPVKPPLQDLTHPSQNPKLPEIRVELALAKSLPFKIQFGLWKNYRLKPF